MNASKLIITISLILFISSCALFQVKSEAIVVPNADASMWDIGFQKDYGIGNGYIREWVPKGENINSWSQLLSVEFIEGVKKSPFDFAAELAAQKTVQCPGTEWSEIKRDQNTIYYKFTFPDCAGHKAQVEITRLFRGNDGLHRLSYAQKGAKMDTAREQYFLYQFDNSFVVKGSPENRLY
jgi:hypothetical protein